MGQFKKKQTHELHSVLRVGVLCQKKKKLIFLYHYAMESEFSLFVSSSEFLSLFEIASVFSIGYTSFYSLIWLVFQEGVKTACTLRRIDSQAKYNENGFQSTELSGQPNSVAHLVGHCYCELKGSWFNSGPCACLGCRSGPIGCVRKATKKCFPLTFMFLALSFHLPSHLFEIKNKIKIFLKSVNGVIKAPSS